MSGLSNGEMLALAGGHVADLEAAEAAEPVTPDDVTQAEKTAAEAEELAAEAERNAVQGKIKPAEATASRERARFARLTAEYTARRAERYAAAQRIRALHAVGEQAVRHAAKLKALKDSVLADLARIDELQAGIVARISGWSEELAGIAGRGAAFDPEPLLPTGVPLPSSGGTWAGTIDARPKVVAGRQVISGIWLEDPNGLVHAIDAATAETSGATASDRLILLPNGVVMTLGADRGATSRPRSTRAPSTN